MTPKEFIDIYGIKYAETIALNSSLFDMYYCPINEQWYSHKVTDTCVDVHDLKLFLYSMREERKGNVAPIIVFSVAVWVVILFFWWWLR